MKLIFILALMIVQRASGATALNLAFPSEGTIMSAQVGLIFEKTDILKKHGFEGKISAMGTGRELKTALVSGHADVILTSQTNFVILLGSGFEGYAIQSLGEAGRMALVVQPDSKIKVLTDLKGKTVATIFGTSIHQPILEWLKDAHLEKDVKVIDLASMAALQAALKTGAVDAIMTWDPFLTQSLNAGTVKSLKEQSFGLITVASAQFVKDREALTRFNAATKEALFYLVQHKAEVNGWFSKMAKLDMKTIDDASRLNKNYQVAQSEKLDMKLSPDFRKHLANEAQFLFATKAVAHLADVEKYILDPL